MKQVLIRNQPALFPCVHCLIEKTTQMTDTLLLPQDEENKDVNLDERHRSWCNDWWNHGSQKTYRSELQSVRANGDLNLFECSIIGGAVVHVPKCSSVQNETIKNFINRNLQDVYASIGAIPKSTDENIKHNDSTNIEMARLIRKDLDCSIMISSESISKALLRREGIIGVESNVDKVKYLYRTLEIANEHYPPCCKDRERAIFIQKKLRFHGIDSSTGAMRDQLRMEIGRWGL